jgi:AcrR family transcriptional regulator
MTAIQAPLLGQRQRKPRTTAEQRQTFLQALEQAYSVTHAARLAGVHRRTFYKVRDRDERFAAAWEEAFELGTEMLEDELRRRRLGRGLCSTRLALVGRTKLKEGRVLRLFFRPLRRRRARSVVAAPQHSVCPRCNRKIDPAGEGVHYAVELRLIEGFGASDWVEGTGGFFHAECSVLRGWQPKPMPGQSA